MGGSQFREEFEKSGHRKSKKSTDFAGFGPRHMEFGFDRLCRGLKVYFLSSGILKKPTTSKKGGGRGSGGLGLIFSFMGEFLYLGNSTVAAVMLIGIAEKVWDGVQHSGLDMICNSLS